MIGSGFIGRCCGLVALWRKPGFARRVGCPWIACFALLWGCGGGERAQVKFDPVEYTGQIDATLPADVQSRQRALKKILDELQRRTAYEALVEHYPEVRFNETRDNFFEGGIALEKWDFNGSTVGNDVPVVLHLLERAPNAPLRKVERTYTVTGSGIHYTIVRKP